MKLYAREDSLLFLKIISRSYNFASQYRKTQGKNINDVRRDSEK